MSKYGHLVPDGHWEDDEDDEPPAWREDTSAADISFDVYLHDQGYQTDRKWTVHCSEGFEGDGLTVMYAVEHQNKGNYWRPGDRREDAVDFVDLPLRVRRRVADVLNRDLSEITPSVRLVEDGDGER